MWAKLFCFVTNHAYERQTDGQAAFSWLDRVACMQCIQRGRYQALDFLTVIHFAISELHAVAAAHTAGRDSN